MKLADPVRWCPRCRAEARDPGTASMSSYAAFWRDNRCPRCGAELRSIKAPGTRIATDQDRPSARGEAASQDSTSKAPSPEIDEELERRQQQQEEDPIRADQELQRRQQKEEDLRERARRLLAAAAQAHRRRLAALEGTQSLDTSAITMADVDCMTGAEFEDFVAALFSGPGRSVEKTEASGDQGGDLVVRQGAQREVVQAKRYSGAVSNAAVQEVVAAKAICGCQSAWGVTNAWFTSGAEQLAEANGVELVSRDRLRLLLEAGRPPERRR